MAPKRERILGKTNKAIVAQQRHEAEYAERQGAFRLYKKATPQKLRPAYGSMAGAIGNIPGGVRRRLEREATRKDR